MKKFLLTIIISVFCLSPIWANQIDLDGQLNIGWSAPAYGSDVDHYIWAYNINGQNDSITGQTPAGTPSNSSVQLVNLGDWAIFSVRAVSINDDTSSAAFSDTVFYSLSVGIEDGQGDLLPDDFKLSAYPNPVQSASFSLGWNVPLNQLYTISIYDILGRKVKDLLSERMTIGEYSQVIENEFAPGLYFAVINSGTVRRVVKLSIIR